MDIYTQMEYIYIYISEQNAFNMFVNANNKIPSPFEIYNYNYYIYVSNFLFESTNIFIEENRYSRSHSKFLQQFKTIFIELHCPSIVER